MKKVTLRIPPDSADYNGIYLTFVVHVEKLQDLSRKVSEMLNENKDRDGAIRVDLSFGLISGRLFIKDPWNVETSIVNVEDDDLGEF